ncbi:10014_t:CDS:1 [Dentiscutata heterogama]|uniref:10014_t:CDS:1 n=1 Tax=Dentiscutata heterogama TaxID=1316150 RepID=A0ACA9NBP2_9GLOM|nr:10014_t:CDS:1 [Dentiscutata heterogama]
MPSVGWTKLTLSELKDLCITCSLSSEGNKEELGERLHGYFKKRKEKLPEVSSSQVGKDPKYNNGIPRDQAKKGDGRGFDANAFIDLDGNDIDSMSQEADKRLREEFASHF